MAERAAKHSPGTAPLICGMRDRVARLYRGAERLHDIELRRLRPSQWLSRCLTGFATEKRKGFPILIKQVRNYRHWNYSDSASQTVSCFFAINFFASSKTLSS